MLHYVKKFTLDILPSVVATVIGAYLVNHYVVTKPAADGPAAAAVSVADPKKAGDAKASDAKPSDDKSSETSAEFSNVREPGVKAKGIAEKAIIEKSAAEKVLEKPASKPAETVSLPADARRQQPVAHEKASVRTASPATSAPVSAPNANTPADAAATTEEHRDASDLARAALERVRGAGEAAPRVQEANHTPSVARIPEAPRVPSAPPVRPLPPAIMVSAPPAEKYDAGSLPMNPPYPPTTRIDDPNRPTPPADIPPAPSSRPVDLHADASEPAPRDPATVAEDMLSAAKSVFHAVLPK